MAEIDYQMALLLQYKFQEEVKQKENTDSDYQLARELQDHFRSEIEAERPGNNLVYKPTSNKNPSTCAVDPSWEIIDPTPDIHVLFIAFNQKFFWNRLCSVTVAWSKKMTSCAGICSYQGRGGLCAIRLSEPLLKLRPRKDLVETLLHEMIHAYLFVTHNNRDRDGHGPEFHKHMYRINAEAGTNISVYHDFHDEVRLYKQHWWRCNGPCQNRKPYFGMVRRAKNRAPGPYDRWWSDHVINCGGTFIKIKSPEKPKEKASIKKKAVPSEENNANNDIRRYITSSSSTSGISNKENQYIPSITSKHSSSTSSHIKPLIKDKINTLSSISSCSAEVSNVISSKASNIFGFTNSSSTSAKPKEPYSGAVKATEKGITKTKTSELTSPSSVAAFSGMGRMLTDSNVSLSNNRNYSVVRDHWLKKFDGKTDSKISSAAPSCSKRIKLSDCDIDQNVECIVCKKVVSLPNFNSHLDQCLDTSSEDERECFICGVKFSSKFFEKHVSDCCARNFGDEFDDDGVESVELIDCPICSQKINSKNYHKHSDTCQPSNKVDVKEFRGTKVCPACESIISSLEFDVHLQNCILGLCDEFDKKYDATQNSTTSCLICNKEILKINLDSHLDECLGMSKIFDTTNIPFEVDEDKTGDENNSNAGNVEDSYNCPFCLVLVVEKEMQAHLDRCLKSRENNDERTILIESLCSTDSDIDDEIL